MTLSPACHQKFATKRNATASLVLGPKRFPPCKRSPEATLRTTLGCSRNQPKRAELPHQCALGVVCPPRIPLQARMPDGTSPMPPRTGLSFSYERQFVRVPIRTSAKRQAHRGRGILIHPIWSAAVARARHAAIAQFFLQRPRLAS